MINYLEIIPQELLIYILYFLNQNDWQKVAGLSRFFYKFIHAQYKNLVFVQEIQKEINLLGYPLPHLTVAFNGINNVADERIYLNLIRKHRSIRDELDLINQSSLENQFTHLRDEITYYQESLENVLGLNYFSDNKVDRLKVEVAQVDFLEGKLKNSLKKTKDIIDNPVLLRMYIDILRIRALINNSNEVSINFYKIIFLCVLLLHRLNDNAAYFCLVDIATKSFVQGKIELLSYIKARLNVKIPDDAFILQLKKQAFAINGLYFDNVADPAILDSFLERFDYLLAFFYSKQHVLLLKKLVLSYQDSGLIIYANIPKVLMRCLLLSFDKIYAKFLSKQAGENLKIIGSHLNAEKAQISQNILMAMTSHLDFLQAWQVAEIFKFPTSLIPILKHTRVKDLSSFNLEFCHYLLLKIQKLQEVFSVLQYWNLEDIKLFLNNEDETLFATISHCLNKSYLFSKLTYQDILHLHQCKFESSDQSCLSLFCDKENLLMVKALLDSATSIVSLTEKISKNATLQSLLRTKNTQLLLTNFPQYFHQIRREQIFFDAGLKYLSKILHNKDYFSLVLSLTQGQHQILIQHLAVLELLQNSLVYKYVKHHNLSLELMKINESLFKMLFLLANERSHLYLLNINFENLILLFEQKLLQTLLKVQSETLVAWILFDITVLPEQYSYYVQNIDIQLRSLDVIAQILRSNLVIALDNFGQYQNNKSDFKHFDYQLTQHLSLREFFMLDKTLYNNKSILDLVCNLPPFCVLLAIKHAKKNITNTFDINVFINFLSSPVWPEISSVQGWIVAHSFKMSVLLSWQQSWLNGTNLLRILTQENNQHVLIKMIKLCTRSDLISFQIQAPVLNVKQDLFSNLLLALSCSGFLLNSSASEKILDKLTAAQIIMLSKHKINDMCTVLDLLLAIAKSNFDLFENLLSLSDMLLVNKTLEFYPEYSSQITAPDVVSLSESPRLSQKRKSEHQDQDGQQKFTKH